MKQSLPCHWCSLVENSDRYYHDGPLSVIVEDFRETAPVLVWRRHGIIPGRADIILVLPLIRAIGIQVYGENFTLQQVTERPHYIIICRPLVRTDIGLRVPLAPALV